MYSDRITIIDNNYTANVLPGNYSYFSEFTLSICGNNFEGVYFENQNQNQETLSEQINSITKGISRSCTFIKNITFTNYIITQQIPYHLPLFINVILVNSVPPFPLRISETSSLTSNTLNPINISNIITFVDTSELFIYGNFITQNFVLADDMNFHFNESSSSF